MFFSRKGIGAVFVAIVLAGILAGCGAEKGIPFAIEKTDGTTPAYEIQSIPLDAKGFVNGTFAPSEASGVHPQHTYPVSYVGSWTMIPEDKSSHWFMITSDQPGSAVTIVSSCSRVVVDVWDYEMYQDPGVVNFTLDGASKGTFSLARKNAEGLKIMDYEIRTNKTTVSTMTMTLQSGRVVISGYLLVYP